MKKVLGPEFFDRPTPTVARDLLGKFLVRRHLGKTTAYMIIETEAYYGFKDKASHAHKRQTLRNSPMFAAPGTIYVYFTYGMHWMLNLVTGKVGHPGAVLIRGVAEVSGPARLTKHLKIDKQLTGLMLGKSAGLWIEDRGVVVKNKQVQKTPRIGIRYAEEWVEKLWRFVLTPPF
ncbi:MAG: DNA-3-methyladenine glycosylase [Candidatus Adlerbacteria bacterium]|nr:DNA-3-methyladenine glycosylase [Candidatus Adlerbacteria bacterium]